MTLSQERLAKTLAAPFRYYERIGSTNDAARDWLEQGAPGGAVVIADEQSAGRGRNGNSWHTPPGAALALSVIMQPKASWLSRVTMLGGLAVCELAEKLGCEDVGIKWPNDVQIAGKKVSGILCEASWSGEALTGAVLGIGINVRTDFQGTALAETATSLESAVGRRLDRAQLAGDLMDLLRQWQRRSETAGLIDSWRRRQSTLGQLVNANGVVGKALDINADGALLVVDACGERHTIHVGELAPLAETSKLQ
ncbi:MAG: biotin--[acetyl-CoA-carboxylase] ligase [Chloroflexi bacterium]|nr:biotin--[acetyl-CoA-carboxylase] ligase [Chloroflexota bacterium]MCY4248429.1 biotin--[acetyl-CoA-carboxylase] ligase [Chloroflexota bacterium]